MEPAPTERLDPSPSLLSQLGCVDPGFEATSGGRFWLLGEGVIRKPLDQPVEFIECDRVDRPIRSKSLLGVSVLVWAY